MESLEIAERIETEFPDVVEDVTLYQGQVSVTVQRDSIFDVCRFLKEDKELWFDYLADLCGCDYPERDERFEVVYNLRSLRFNYLVRLKVRISEDEPSGQSVSSLWASAGWFEREAFDMFGITFPGNPDLRRILMPEDWEGNPLRKDYPLRGDEDWKWPGLKKVEELHQHDRQWSIDARRPVKR